MMGNREFLKSPSVYSELMNDRINKQTLCVKTQLFLTITILSRTIPR